MARERQSTYLHARCVSGVQLAGAHSQDWVAADREPRNSAAAQSTSTFEGHHVNTANAVSTPAHRRPGTLALAISVALLAAQAGISPAFAQQAATASPQQETTTSKGEAEAPDAQDLDAVVVTGSRIRREVGFDGPAPVTSISAERIATSGQTQIVDLLN